MNPREHHQPGRVAIVGTGAYLPERVLTNQDLEKMVETTDEWIVTRTGIRERHIAREDEASSDMAAVAATRALESAGISARDVDGIIVTTVTPDMLFPSTASIVQQRIGAEHAFCYDVEAACAGFIYGLEIARGMLVAGTARTMLVIGAEKLTSFTDWEDRATCVLFGDAAGAAVLRMEHHAEGILSTVLGCNGALTGLLYLPAGGSRMPPSPETIKKRLHYMKMQGRDVFRHAVCCMADAALQAVQKAGLTKDQIDWVIPHQANMRIIQAVSERIGIPLERFCVNVDRVGNTSSATIPVALDEAVRDKRIRKGHHIVFVAFGGGFTWGAMVVRWEK